MVTAAVPNTGDSFTVVYVHNNNNYKYAYHSIHIYRVRESKGPLSVVGILYSTLSLLVAGSIPDEYIHILLI
jgi:hypothetical protein